MTSESFPCLICGRTLLRDMDEYEAQPRDGVMCQTSGNYGSRVYDSLDLSFIAFNICDDCFEKAGEQGRLMTTRGYKPVTVPGLGRVGATRCDRPYIPWHRNLAEDREELSIDIDELAELVESGTVELNRGLQVQDLIDHYNHLQQDPPPGYNPLA
jgi:hypothetical protein